MARSREKHESLVHQAEVKLKSKLAIGHPNEDIRWYLGHNDIATTRTYIMNNQGKQKTSRKIVNALSEMNGSDVLMGTQNS